MVGDCHLQSRRLTINPRGEKRADVPQFRVGCAVHDGHESVFCEKCRKLLVRNTLIRQTLHGGRRHQHKADPRVRQPTVSGSHHRCAEGKVHLAEPCLDACRFERVVKFLGGTLPVRPRMAQEAVAEIGLVNRHFLDRRANRSEVLHLRGRVRDHRTSARPARLGRTARCQGVSTGVSSGPSVPRR